LVIAISPAEPREFVLPCDRKLPETEQTVWLVRYFTVDQHAQLANEVKAGTKREDWTGLVLLVLRCGLVGVRNFRDASGAEIAFEEMSRNLLGTKDLRGPTDAFLSRIPAPFRDELAKTIIKQVEQESLTEDEVKN
jgi:hypothetical protein